jgi:hypothetical protein
VGLTSRPRIRAPADERMRLITWNCFRGDLLVRAAEGADGAPDVQRPSGLQGAVRHDATIAASGYNGDYN